MAKSNLDRFSCCQPWNEEYQRKFPIVTLQFSQYLMDTLLNPPTLVTMRIYELLVHLVQTQRPHTEVEMRDVVKWMELEENGYMVIFNDDFSVKKKKLHSDAQKMFKIFCNFYFYDFKFTLSAFYTSHLLGVLQFMLTTYREWKGYLLPVDALEFEKGLKGKKCISKVISHF